jgi:chloramphenicol 3-O-phosphotransferase
MAAAFLITGIPGAGKTTVSHLLARHFDRSAHIEADQLQRMIVSGGLWPDQPPRGEAIRQLRLRASNCALLAANFSAAGFVAVIDDVIVTRDRLSVYSAQLHHCHLHLVVLAPDPEVVLKRDAGREEKKVGGRWMHLDGEQRRELAGHGQWLDTSDLAPAETVARILDPSAMIHSAVS